MFSKNSPIAASSSLKISAGPELSVAVGSLGRSMGGDLAMSFDLASYNKLLANVAFTQDISYSVRI